MRAIIAPTIMASLTKINAEIFTILKIINKATKLVKKVARLNPMTENFMLP